MKAVSSMAVIGSASRRAKIQSFEENEKRNPISQLTYTTSDTKGKPESKCSFGLLNRAGRGIWVHGLRS
jgi:hypothetical protein